MTLTKIQNNHPVSCYGIQSNFASIRFIGEFPDKSLRIWCTGAIPHKDFKCHFPMLEWEQDPETNGKYWTTLKSGNKHDIQRILSMRIMACPGVYQEAKVVFGAEGSDLTTEVALVNGSGFSDIEVSRLDLGLVETGKKAGASVVVTNHSEFPVEITKAEFNSANIICEPLSGSLFVAPGKSETLNIRYFVRGVYDATELTLKLYYNVDVNEEEYAVIGVNSVFNIGKSGGMVEYRVTKFTDFEGLEIPGSQQRDAVYLGNTDNIHYGAEVSLGVRFDNESSRDVLVKDLKYSSAVTNMEVEFDSGDVTIPSGEAKTLKFKFRNNGVLGFGIGILTFTTRELNTGLPDSIMESHKIFFSWGKNK